MKFSLVFLSIVAYAAAAPLAAPLPPMDPLAIISQLTEGLSSDCAKELQTMVDKLKKIIPFPEPQGVLARAVQPPPPQPAPTGAQPSGAPPAPPATDADLDQCYTGGTYYPRPYYPTYQPAPYPYPYPAPVPPAPITSPTTNIAQILSLLASNPALAQQLLAALQTPTTPVVG